jgi:uncharacterized repeat protein (TIGR01451 family)
VKQGHNVTYTLTVDNDGPDSAQALVSEALDRKLTFVSASGGACTTPTVGTSGTIVCTLPIASGSSATVTVVAKAKVVGLATNRAATSLVAPATDPNPAGNHATATVRIVRHHSKHRAAQQGAL